MGTTANLGLTYSDTRGTGVLWADNYEANLGKIDAAIGGTAQLVNAVTLVAETPVWTYTGHLTGGTAPTGDTWNFNMPAHGVPVSQVGNYLSVKYTSTVAADGWYLITAIDADNITVSGTGGVAVPNQLNYGWSVVNTYIWPQRDPFDSTAVVYAARVRHRLNAASTAALQLIPLATNAIDIRWFMNWESGTSQWVLDTTGANFKITYNGSFLVADPVSGNYDEAGDGCDFVMLWKE